ncbi:MAG: hypothetical protein KF721_04945 [Ignavibacteriaceae bacterium]|nr:hypothetical protein [Ignavibacteriaceae bacterium]HRI46721.1 hypothetical protein [Ignavibacteriaceae bacterium]
MGKVKFSVQYEIDSTKRDEFLIAIKELRTFLKVDGLLSYSVYEIKGKANNFEEVYVFSSKETYDNYDDGENERMQILISKIEDLKVPSTTKYNTLYEVVFE